MPGGEEASAFRRKACEIFASEVLPKYNDDLLQIADILSQEKIPIPTYYWINKGCGRGGKKESSDPYKWTSQTVSKILESIRGKKVKLSYCEDQEDIDLFDRPVTVEDFEGNWIKISSVTKKGETIEKLIPVSSILSFDIVKED